MRAVTLWLRARRLWSLPFSETASRVGYRLRRALSPRPHAVDDAEWTRRDDAVPVAFAPADGLYRLVLDDEADEAADGLPRLDAGLLQQPGAWPADLRGVLFAAPGMVLRTGAAGAFADALRPGVRLAYCDEDCIDALGARSQPVFKPGWDLDLLLEHDYVSDLFAVDRDTLVDALRRPLPRGAGRQAIALRAADVLGAGQAVRIPRVLAHRRSMAAARRDWQPEVLRDWIAHSPHAAGAVLSGAAGRQRVRWAGAALPRISVILPTRDFPGLLETCLDSLERRTDYPDLELVIVDNGSRDPRALALIEGARVRGAIVVRRDEAFNFSRLVNAGVAAARGEYVCLLNNDIDATDPAWLREMAALAVRPGTGVVGAALRYPDGALQHAGILLGMHGAAANLKVSPGAWRRDPDALAPVRRGFSAVTGACMLVRRSVFDAVNGFDPRFAVCFNDVDFCLRVRAAGWAVVWTPDAELVHRESASRGPDRPASDPELAASLRLLHKRWSAVLADDPAYNPNLSLDNVPFAVSLSRSVLPANAR